MINVKNEALATLWPTYKQAQESIFLHFESGTKHLAGFTSYSAKFLESHRTLNYSQVYRIVDEAHDELRKARDEALATLSKFWATPYLSTDKLYPFSYAGDTALVSPETYMQCVVNMLLDEVTRIGASAVTKLAEAMESK